jgi:hypothetical protein
MLWATRIGARCSDSATTSISVVTSSNERVSASPSPNADEPLRPYQLRHTACQPSSASRGATFSQDQLAWHPPCTNSSGIWLKSCCRNSIRTFRVRSASSGSSTGCEVRRADDGASIGRRVDQPPVPWTRMPGPALGEPAEARASAGRSTRRRIQCCADHSRRGGDRHGLAGTARPTRPARCGPTRPACHRRRDGS